MNVPGGRLNLCKGLVARAHLTIPALLHWEEYIGQWSREQVAVPTVLPKGAAARSTHPTRREASLADGRPSVGGGGRLADTSSPATRRGTKRA